jgi:hypothetical protein
MRLSRSGILTLGMAVLVLLGGTVRSAAIEPQRYLTPQQAKGALGRTDPNDPRPQNNFYYYANGNRVSNADDATTTTKATSSFYDDRKFTVYYYTTKLSDLYWCLLVVLGWTVWMMHSIHSLRQSSLPASGTDNDPSSPTPLPEESFPIFRQRYPSLLHVRGHVLEVRPDPERTDAHTLVVDYVVERQTAVTTERLQLRKYFETSTPAQVGFANIDLLVLPDDPRCAILLPDYEAYQREEEGIQRVIQEEEQFRRRRKWRSPLSKGAVKSDPMAVTTVEHNTPTLLLPNHHPRPVMTAAAEETADEDVCHHDSNVILDDEGDDDWLGFEMCRDWFDCSTMDAHQWKQMSLLFATLLVVASGIGCVQVVRRMDPHQRWLGWLSLLMGFLIMAPTAIWIHRVLRLCHRWSSEPSLEKQGFIVQSSTRTGMMTSSPEEYPAFRRLPSCAEALADFCPPGAAQCAPSTTAFSYVVPELSGCYFIHYPTAANAATRREAPPALAPQPSTSSSLSSLSEGDRSAGRSRTQADRSV